MSSGTLAPARCSSCQQPDSGPACTSTSTHALSARGSPGSAGRPTSPRTRQGSLPAQCTQSRASLPPITIPSQCFKEMKINNLTAFFIFVSAPPTTPCHKEVIRPIMLFSNPTFLTHQIKHYYHHSFYYLKYLEYIFESNTTYKIIEERKAHKK